MSEAGLSLETATRRTGLGLGFASGVFAAAAAAAEMRAVTAERLDRRVAVRVGEGGGMVVIASEDVMLVEGVDSLTFNCE